MHVKKKLLAGGVAALATTGLIATTAIPANAEPVRPYAATGSDTIQDVWNYLTNDGTAVAPSIASYNAFDSNGNTALIQTKTGGSWFTRPSGSGEGVNSLSAVWDSAYSSHAYGGGVLNHEDVDFARSSSGPGAGAGLTYIPFARDAVSVAVNITGLSGLNNLNLTTSQLTELFGGVDNSSNDASPATVVVHITKTDGTASTSAATAAHAYINGVEVFPRIPQTGSGTRKFFLTAIGVSNSKGAEAAYVTDPGLPADGGRAENSGDEIADLPGALIPFSAAQWIAQKKLAPGIKDTVDPSGKTLNLINLNGKTAVSSQGSNPAAGDLFVVTDPSGDAAHQQGYTGVGAARKFNVAPTAGLGVFARDTYNIVPTKFVSTGATSKQTNLVNVLSGNADGQIDSAAGEAAVRLFGFGVLDYIGQTSARLAGGYGAGY